MMAKEKHIPLRTCIATGVKKPKNELIRVVRLDDEDARGEYTVQIDVKGKLRGRGANIDMNIEAFELALKKKAISRALKLERLLTEEEIEKLRSDFVAAVEEKEFRQGQKHVVLKVSKQELEQKLSA